MFACTVTGGVLVEEFDGRDPDRAKGRKPDAVIEN